MARASIRMADCGRRDGASRCRRGRTIRDRTSTEEPNVMGFRLKGAVATALLALIGLGAGSEADRGAARVDERVAALQPTADERRIDRIGWARDIRSALRLGREHGRPV